MDAETTPPDALPGKWCGPNGARERRGVNMSPKLTTLKTPNQPPESTRGRSLRGYLTALFFTAVGLALLMWAIGQGALTALSGPEHADEVSVVALVLEGVTGMLTSVFGFAMLVQATPSVDAESLSVWALPEQRTFDDEPPRSAPPD